MWNKLFAVFINFLFFFHPIFHAYLSLQGIEQGAGQKQYFNIVISIIAWLLFFHYYLFGKEKITKHHRKVLIVVFFVGICYWLTGQFYGDMPHGYYASLLGWGSAGLSGMLAGIMIMDKRRLIEVSKLIPYFSIITTIVITSFTYVAGEIVRYGNDFGWDYQIISYYMADCFLLNAYYLFFFKEKPKTLFQRILNIAVVFTMFVDAYQAYYAGGRGGAVLQTFALIFILLYLLKNKYISVIQVAFITVISIVGFMFIANKMDLMGSEGFGRISDFSSFQSDGRVDLYKSAFNYWEKSPIIGYGIGSIWHTVGYYSHNIFTDVLVEGGMIGFIFIVFLLFRALVRLYKYSLVDKNLVLVLFYSFTGLIMLLFSAYWFDNEQFWFLMGAAWSVDYKKIMANWLSNGKGYNLRFS